MIDVVGNPISTIRRQLRLSGEKIGKELLQSPMIVIHPAHFGFLFVFVGYPLMILPSLFVITLIEIPPRTPSLIVFPLRSTNRFDIELVAISEISCKIF